MDCEAYKRLVSRQIDGALSEAEGKDLDRHLEACSGCSAFRKDLWALQSFFAAEEVPPAPPGLCERALLKARPELARRRSGTVLHLLKRLCAAALFLFALTLALVFFSSTDPVQAVNKEKKIHYEDLFQRAGLHDPAMIEILGKTDNPSEALRVYLSNRRP